MTNNVEQASFRLLLGETEFEWGPVHPLTLLGNLNK